MIDYLLEFLVVFVLALVSNAVVVYVWNLVLRGEGAFDWERAIVLAIVLGVLLPTWRRVSRRQGHAKE